MQQVGHLHIGLRGDAPYDDCYAMRLSLTGTKFKISNKSLKKVACFFVRIRGVKN